MANWIRGERAAGIIYNNWNAVPADGIVNLRPALLIRFGPKYTTGGAVAAIADLKQRHSETAASFMDRVKIAVDMLHYVQRERRGQKCSLSRILRMHGNCTVWWRPSGRLTEKVFGVPTPPNTIGAVLTAVTAAEAEKHSKSTRLVVGEVMGEKDKTSSDEEKKDPEVSAIESLQSQMTVSYTHLTLPTIYSV